MGQKCSWTGSTYACVAAGPTPIGAACTTDTCVAGGACVDDGADKLCRHYCKVSADCSGGKCAYPVPTPIDDTRTCSYVCDPKALTGCAAGRSCYVRNLTTAPELTQCLTPGTKAVGQSCSTTVGNDCAPGLTCVNTVAGSTCRQVCAKGSTCATGACGSLAGWTTWGWCPL